MQRPDKKGKDYENNNPWCTVKQKKPRNQSRNRSVEKSRAQPTKKYNEEPDNFSRKSTGRFTRFQDRKPDSFSGRPPSKPVITAPPTPPVPTGPNYASVTKRDDNESNDEITVSPEEDEFKPIIPSIQRTNRRKHTVRNQVPRPNNNVSYDVWEQTYFKHVLELRDIFSKGVDKLGIETSSINFIDIFSNFIRECSSGEISKYIEGFDDLTDELYMEYTIKRNEL